MNISISIDDLPVDTAVTINFDTHAKPNPEPVTVTVTAEEEGGDRPVIKAKPKKRIPHFAVGLDEEEPDEPDLIDDHAFQTQGLGTNAQCTWTITGRFCGKTKKEHVA